MAKGTFTVYEGKSKKTGNTFTALMLEHGKFNKMIFLESELELDYLKGKVEKYVPPKYRNNVQSVQTGVPESQTYDNLPSDTIDLNSEDNPNPAYFD